MIKIKKAVLNINYILDKMGELKGRRCHNRDLANLLDVSEATITSWKYGKNEPKLKHIMLISDELQDRNILNLIKYIKINF